MRKFIPLILIAAISVPLMINAQDSVEIENPLGENSNIWSLIDSIIDFVFILSIPIASIMILVAGYYFVTAMGNPEKIQLAKKMILWIVVGLFVVFLSKALIVLLGEVIGVDIGPPAGI